MNLRFDYLVIGNFASFVAESFRLGDYPAGLNFVRGVNEYEPSLGANDAGKSTLWNALTWCLYGKTIDNLHNPDIIPWHHKGATSVALTFHEDETKHVLKRSVAPNRLTLDGETIGQDWIDTRLPFALYRHTLLLGQGQPLFFDLEPRRKMDLLAEALLLEKWVEYSKRADGATDALLHRQSELTSKVTASELTISSVKKMLGDAQRAAQDWEASRGEALRDKRGELAGRRKELEAAEGRKAGVETTLENAETELKALSAEVATLERGAEELKKELKVLEGNKCPTCGQTLKGEGYLRHKEDIKRKIADNKEYVHKARRHLEATNPHEPVLLKLKASMADFEAKIEKAISGRKLYLRQCNDAAVAIGVLEHAIEALENNRNPHREQVQTLRKRISSLQQSTEDTEDEIKELNKRIERTRYWIKGFKDVQLFVIDEVLGELELTTNQMLPDVGLFDWEIKFAVERETASGGVQRGLHVMIQAPEYDKPVKWASWGGGVGQRLRLVGALALSDVLLNHMGLSTNIEILDEPTQHLSREGVRDLCPFLSERGRLTNKSIFLVDHQVIPSSSFASVTTIIKDQKRVSRILTENRD